MMLACLSFSAGGGVLGGALPNELSSLLSTVTMLPKLDQYMDYKVQSHES